jgi:hypothetical protein
MKFLRSNEPLFIGEKTEDQKVRSTGTRQRVFFSRAMRKKNDFAPVQ